VRSRQPKTARDASIEHHLSISTAPELPALLSSSDVARLIGVKVAQVSRLAKRGDLPARRVAGRWLFVVADIERLIAARPWWLFNGHPCPPPKSRARRTARTWRRIRLQEAGMWPPPEGVDLSPYLYPRGRPWAKPRRYPSRERAKAAKLAEKAAKAAADAQEQLEAMGIDTKPEV